MCILSCWIPPTDMRALVACEHVQRDLDLLTEVSALLTLDHPHIVRVRLE